MAKTPPLPTWSAEDKERLRKGEIVVGIGLLTDALEKEQAEQKPAAVEVIIEAVQAKPQLPGMEELSGEAVINAAYLEKYFGQRPEGALIDPQQLLSMQERADLKYALDQHKEVSEIPMYVYLFDAKQQLPEGYTPQEVYDKSFVENEEPVVLVYYFMGAPSRSEFLLAGGASEEVPEWQVRELLWNSAHKAGEKSDIFDQLNGFVGQLSMRLFWVEEILNELRHQFVQAGPAAEEGESQTHAKTEKLKEVWDSMLAPHVMDVLMYVLISLLAAGAVFLIVYTRRYRFPENPSPQRLGGAVGGKSGGLLRYRDARVPPSMQRKQFEKDFL
ncbi:hypothetical protein ACFPK9_13745 [Rubritalea spongiae]|uniref:Uncharacterized protein n=1 Tax=Rubritalea spongiae TaxID=430797 RepID=A0ABW5E0V4_9BACT